MFEQLTANLSGPVLAFFQVIMIDVALAGDNAVAVGLAASGLPDKDRRKAIILGLGGAMVMLICFALVAVQLLNIIGLLFAGGILLLWVCWKMWRDLHDPHHDKEAEGEAALEDATTGHHKKIRHKGKPKTLGGALITILLADISMSLDNVLAVAGAAREHPYVLVFGLILSVTLMGVAATFIARLLMKWRWLAYIGLAIIFYVSLHMIWEGHRQVVVKTNNLTTYNQTVPGFMAIGPEEAEEINSQKKD
jgi:YjbE family integral membrane protein